MCEFSSSLIAWLDDELPPDQAARLERHLASCDECRASVAVYQDVTASFAEYCDAIACVPNKPNRRWMAIASAAVAAGLVLSIILPRSHADRLALAAPKPVPAPAIAWRTTPVLRARVPAKRIRKLAQAQAAITPPPQTNFEIAIPVEELLPPGAFPEGVQFVANVKIAADGWPESIRIIQ